LAVVSTPSICDVVCMTMLPNVPKPSTATGGGLLTAICTLEFHISTEISSGGGRWLQHGVSTPISRWSNLGAKKHSRLSAALRPFTLLSRTGREAIDRPANGAPF
jgi:hypothetical protein